MWRGMCWKSLKAHLTFSPRGMRSLSKFSCCRWRACTLNKSEPGSAVLRAWHFFSICSFVSSASLVHKGKKFKNNKKFFFIFPFILKSSTCVGKPTVLFSRKVFFFNFYSINVFETEPKSFNCQWLVLFSAVTHSGTLVIRYVFYSRFVAVKMYILFIF